jgi:EAL and modified HD-GYP domain-containing signal transduction protein
MTTPVSSPPNLHLLSRNPVFSAAKNVWGYEIQSTTAMASDLPAGEEQGTVGTAVIAGDFVGLNTILARNKKILLTYSREQLRQLFPYAVPARSSVILLRPEQQADEELLPALEQMVADGHTIALEWSPGVTTAARTMELARMVCLASPDMAQNPALERLAKGKTRLVRGVDTREALEALQGVGEMFFQGRFFKTPEIIPGRKLSTHQNSRLKILRIVEEPSPDLNLLSKTIQSDVSLSYRLLTYLNSPGFGFMRKIDSIRQAISLLGWLNIRNWLRAVLLADIVQGEAQTELLHLSLWRGKFLEQLVARNDYWDFKPDEMFLLGMFSLLDAVLGISMTDALAFLPLTDTQKKALCGVEPTEYAPLMILMNAFEDNDKSAIDRAVQDLGLDMAAARRMHCEAGAWAAALLEIGSSKPK